MANPKTKQKFVNKVIKQGNSLCVRIPFRAAKKMDIRENSVLLVELTNFDTLQMPSDLFEAYQKIPALGKYSLNNIKKYLLAMNVEKSSGKKTNKNAEYLEFKKLVLKNKKKIKRNLMGTQTYKKYKGKK